MAGIPLTWNDPMFSDNANSAGVSVQNGGTVSNKSITGIWNDTASVVGYGSFSIDDVRINSKEGVRIAANGTVNISNSYIETTGPAGDHADGIQVYGPSHVNVNVTNTTIVSHNGNATAGFFDADGTDGTFTFNNVVFQGGPYGLRINADAGPGHEYNVALKDVYFIKDSFGYDPFLIYVPPGYGGAELNITQWDNVRYATIVNGQLVAGELIAPPQPVEGSPSTPTTPAPPTTPTTPTTPTAPAAPTIASFSTDSGVAGDKITSDKTLELKGTAAAGSTVKFYDGTTQIGSAVANGSGAWTYTTAALSDGNHSLKATATTASGTSASSSVLAVKIDTTAPTAPTMSTPTNNANGGLNLAGTAEASSVVKVFDGTTQIGTATANSNGVWGYTTGALAAGSHSLTAKATDAAGNTGAASAVVTASTSSFVIETSGSTNLAQAGNVYQLNPDGGGTGPTVKYLGSSITVGQFSGWSPIGAEATASGYQVAWKLAGADKYTVWNTDANGNDTVQLLDSVSRSSTALQAIETSFNQDLNGDGVIGIPNAPVIPSVVIDTSGSTSLVQAGNVYQLNPVGGGTGPTVKYLGSSITVGQFSGWSPIGAEATASGYQVAWKLAGADKYTVWNTDANGNDTVQLLDSVSRSSTALQAIETSFHQDLNGDGQIGSSGAAAPASSVALTTMYKNWSDIVTIKGVADANIQIKLYDGNASLGTVTTAADGTWSFKTSSAVSDTVHTYAAKQIDSTGQVVGTSGNAILGSTGSDTLKGTSGNDIFAGSGQGDTFVFAANFGRDIIKDFTASGSTHDTIQFSKTVFDSFASVLSHASQVGEDVAISTGNDTLTLKNTKLGALSSNDFHFA